MHGDGTTNAQKCVRHASSIEAREPRRGNDTSEHRDIDGMKNVV